MWALLLVVLAPVVQASAQSPPVVPFAQDYKTSLMKYTVVDRSDGLSRDLYASRAAIDAVKRNPDLREFPAGVLFALDVYSARDWWAGTARPKGPFLKRLRRVIWFAARMSALCT